MIRVLPRNYRKHSDAVKVRSSPSTPYTSHMHPFDHCSPSTLSCQFISALNTSFPPSCTCPAAKYIPLSHYSRRSLSVGLPLKHASKLHGHALECLDSSTEVSQDSLDEHTIIDQAGKRNAIVIDFGAGKRACIGSRLHVNLAVQVVLDQSQQQSRVAIWILAYCAILGLGFRLRLLNRFGESGCVVDCDD